MVGAKEMIGFRRHFANVASVVWASEATNSLVRQIVAKTTNGQSFSESHKTFALQMQKHNAGQRNAMPCPAMPWSTVTSNSNSYGHSGEN